MGSPDESRQPDSQAERELKEANDRYSRALAERDEAVLNAVIGDNFVLAYPFEGDDKGQFIADVLSGDVSVESLQPHDVTMRVSGDTAIVFGSETANWRYKHRDLSGLYRFVRVYSKQHGSWKIVALHLCSPSHR